MPPTAFGNFPLKLDLSPLGLFVVLVLVGIVFATASVVFVYHWRRFPYEQDVFNRVEKLYFSISIVLFAVALFGIMLS